MNKPDIKGKCNFIKSYARSQLDPEIYLVESIYDKLQDRIMLRIIDRRISKSQFDEISMIKIISKANS